VITFNADEVFEMAEQIERNGAGFYRKAAGLAPGKPAADLLLDLAKAEEDHQQTFAHMRSQLSANERAETAFDPQGEGALYLHAMVQGRIFNFKAVPADKLTGAESLEDILRIAIELEKDSILFYYTLRKMVPEEAGKARIHDIIDQEVGHIATLSKRMAQAV
jgi:rubrerythrin